MKPLVALLAANALAIAIAWAALEPPAPRGADVAPTAFSAARALPDIQAIAQRPHPSGSADAERVRSYVAARMAALGLRPEWTAGPYPNLVGILAGADPAAPAVALTAHADSVPQGPGAADDAAGVAAVLETVRALKAAGPHRRGVMVLITDGEEAGLKGSRPFFGRDPRASRIGVVLNLEARGNRGRAVMFETHRRAGALIEILVRHGALHGASSLMPDLYRRLPNDTDLSNALRTGHQGLNFAFFGGEAAYHTAEDTTANLQLGSVQHLGDQVLAAALTLADAAALPPLAQDQVYGDLLGGPVVQYPAWKGWLLIGLGAALTALAFVQARRKGWLTVGDAIRGAGLMLSIVVADAVLLFAAGRAAAGLGRPLLERYPAALAGYALLAAGGALAVVAVCARRSPPWGAWMGALAVGLVAAAALQAIAPLDAFMLAWPTLAGSAAAAMAARGWRIAAAAVVVVALAQVFYWAGLMFALVGIGLPVILAGFVGLAALLLMPVAVTALSPRRAH